MIQKQKHSILNRYTIGILLLLVAAAISALVVTKHNRTDAAPSLKPGIGAAVPSQFSFAGTIGWWQGATNKTSMALFHNGDSCFTSVQHINGTADIAAELQKLQVSQAGEGGTATPGAVLAATLQTKSGPEQYELHQYTLTNPGMDILHGLELGYLQLPGSYVKIEGHCDTADELSATIPALQAITFDEAK